jgi:glutaminyl-tRNA synthetase
MKITKNFIEEIIERDISKSIFNKLRFRFPPEPNGYLHLGHAKAICLNFGLSKKYNAPINLRFDDTNPNKEEKIFIESIKKDIIWMGFKWNKESYASNYFNKLYLLAKKFIQIGKAYVDEQSQYIINLQRKNPFEPGIESPYRNQSISINLAKFEMMKKGKFKEGSCVLRAKINMNSPNMNLRDPIMYRIINTPHYKTVNKWYIYPTYDWAHGQIDYLEKISHSLCSIEFENHRPLYNWYIHKITDKKVRPKQYEFSRLNLTYTITSKRKLQKIIETKIVDGWDDPRMPTISGFKRRGYIPEAIHKFCNNIGITKRDNIIDISIIEGIIRELLNKTVPRIMVVINPLQIIIVNYPSNKIEWVEAIKKTTEYDIRSIPFSKIIFIESEDFREKSSIDFFRLTIGGEIRLKNAYILKCTGYRKNKVGKIIELYCQYDRNKSSLRKIKCTLHWISIKHAKKIEIRFFDRLFIIPEPNKKSNFLDYINHNSISIISGYAEPYIKHAKSGDRFQFQRIGYFYCDNYIFNCIVYLKNKFK